MNIHQMPKNNNPSSPSYTNLLLHGWQYSNSKLSKTYASPYDAGPKTGWRPFTASWQILAGGSSPHTRAPKPWLADLLLNILASQCLISPPTSLGENNYIF